MVLSGMQAGVRKRNGDGMNDILDVIFKVALILGTLSGSVFFVVVTVDIVKRWKSEGL